MMKHATYSMGSASFLEQMRRGQEFMTKLHEVAIECGAVWDEQDGYAFTEEQYERYVARTKDMLT